MRLRSVILIGVVFLLGSCQIPVEDVKAKSVSPELTNPEPERTVVETVTLTRQTFQKEIISQGKIEAKYFSDVPFDLNEQIEEVLVETGQRVEKGSLLARLRGFELQNKLQKIEYRIEQAKIEIEAKLISIGYSSKDSLVPPAILKTVHLESNIKGLEIERELALYKLEHTKVVAPITGIVVDVEAQAGNVSSNYKKLCTIIDDQRLEAVFPILEQELPLVRKRQKVKVKPIANQGKSYNASIRTFIPQVDEHGMIKVFAPINQPDGKLLDGMNVSAYIIDQIKDKLVIPKSAVVDRQGRQVVFVNKDGEAHWKYVQVELENSEFYTISEGLEVGDELIVNNNFHLSHLEKIKVEH